MAIFDPRLQFVHSSILEERGAPTIGDLLAWGTFGVHMRGGQPHTRVLLDFEGSLGGAIEAGFQPTSVVEPLAAGWIALSNLGRLLEAPNVTSVESSRPLRNELDASIPDVGADKVWSHNPPNRGTNVIVGIVDSGIEYRHPAFLKSNTDSRILAIWDQKLVPDASLSERSPAPFTSVPVTYGVEYEKPQIDAALAGGKSLRHADSPDRHGTHVAGIAAGNGRSMGTYIGVAPEADLIVVAANLDTSLGDSGNVVDAITYLFDKAQRLGRPIVINLSQGDNIGPHDGTSKLERNIDRLLGQPGRAIVKSAGNNGYQDVHARFHVTAASIYQLPFHVPPGVTAPDSIDIWYSGHARLAVRLVTPSGKRSGSITPPASASVPVSLPNGNSAFISSNVSNWFNHDHQITIHLLPGTFPLIQTGTWIVELSEQGGFPTDVDAWIEASSPVPRFVGAGATRLGTITVPGTSQKVITVGAYVTKASSGVGGMPGFSSWGPCRNGLSRPDLTAPGQEIESADSTSGGGSYVRREGTSAAAPHVAGAIALMFAEDPSLTQAQILNHLVATARTDSFTGTPPGVGWGAGKLDVEAACNAVKAAKSP
jgi:subtilisin family serine protease